MASGATLKDLIAAGRLRVGTQLHHPARRHPERAAEAEVVRDGLRVRGQTYPTPSGAAKAVNGGKPVQGWLFWKLPDGRHLDALRGR